MRCQNNMYNKNNQQRCQRTADKKLLLKDPNELRQQFTLWICNECFLEKMHGDQLFKDRLIHVTELSVKK
jgi:hypothetical protein